MINYINKATAAEKQLGNAVCIHMLTANVLVTSSLRSVSRLRLDV